MPPRILYHYTCDHGHQAIGKAGWLKPIRQHAPEAAARMSPELGWLADLLWLTDLDTPEPKALGLTRGTIACDRTRWRYVASPSTHVPTFAQWTRQLARPMRRTVLLELVYDVPGVRPAHWWVSVNPVRGVLG